MLVFQILQNLIIRVVIYICVSLYFTDRITDLIFKIKVFFPRNYYLSTWLTSNKHKMQILLLHSALRLYKKGGFCIRLYLKIFETLFHNYLPCNVKLSLFLQIFFGEKGFHEILFYFFVLFKDFWSILCRKRA